MLKARLITLYLIGSLSCVPLLAQSSAEKKAAGVFAGVILEVAVEPYAE
jgi:hypothetical protein